MINRPENGALEIAVHLTFIEFDIFFGVLGEGEAVRDLQTVFNHQAKQNTLNHLTTLALLLVVLNDL